MATIFSDDFNRADNDSLGGDWTERGADFLPETSYVTRQPRAVGPSVG